ncbi:MAG: MFS transporter [Phycisphaerae bacterium]|nr:MFS transporter [Phycisphaerae bacterium]
MLKATWIAGLLMCGMGAAVLGSLKVALARRLDLDEARIGGLVSIFGFAMIPVMLIMGFLTDLLDKQLVVVAGSLLMVASLVVLSRARKYGAALLAIVLLSAGWSGLVNVLNVLMGAAFGGEPTYHMNLGNFFFGLGAFLTPLAVAAILKRAGFVAATWVLAAVALLPGLLALGVDFVALAGPPATQPTQVPGVWTLLTDPIMWLTALALLFYCPMEATMGAWTTTYLGDKGVSETRASAMLSGFWLAFMLSRLFTALVISPSIQTASATNILIIVLGLLCVVVWAGAVASPNRGMACAMVILGGLVFGPTFPTIIGVLTGHVDSAVAGRAVGLFFMVGGVGWTIVPIMIGAYARRTSVQKAFMIAVGAAVGLTLAGVVLRPFMN